MDQTLKIKGRKKFWGLLWSFGMRAKKHPASNTLSHSVAQYQRRRSLIVRVRDGNEGLKPANDPNEQRGNLMNHVCTPECSAMDGKTTTLTFPDSLVLAKEKMLQDS